MRITVVNPNTTVSMTEKIGRAAAGVAAPGTRIIAVNPAMGPVSIEGYYDEAYCIPGMLDEIRSAEREGTDGYIVACFDDTGLDAARTVAGGPVVGICEAAMHVATLIAGSFTVVTTVGNAIPVIEHLARRYGFDHHMRRARAADIRVLDLERPGSGAVEKLRAEIRLALREDRPEAIILGCAGMTDLAAELAREFGLPVIDGVAAAVKLIEGLVALGLRTSRAGGYAAPAPKAYTGEFARFAPGPIEMRLGSQA